MFLKKLFNRQPKNNLTNKKGAPCSLTAPGSVTSQTLAAFNALMSADPILQKSALAAAASQQQQAAVAALLGGAAGVGTTGDSLKRETNSPATGGGDNNGSA